MYDVDIVPQQGDVLKGDKRLIAKVYVTHDGEKAGMGTVRAWTPAGLNKRGERLGLELVARHKDKRSEPKRRRLRELTAE